ncbi:MAG: hypothetical protein ACC628_06120 [Pirellulaceae bacterium]
MQIRSDLKNIFLTPGLARVEMEAELLRRGIPLYEVTEEQLNAELAAMDRLEIPG